LKIKLTLGTVAILLCLAGCNKPVEMPQPIPAPEGKELFTVDFQQGQTLRYRFTSRRNIVLDWGWKQENKTGRRGGGAEEAAKMSESMVMVIAYTPVDVNPYGLTTVKATCESVEVNRTKPRGSTARDSQDAVKSLAGKSFTFTVRPDGKVEDYSQLDQLIVQIGEKAFTTRAGQGRVKNPDMIGDFVQMQWFLWDAVSSIPDPLKGVAVGESWNSALPLPVPMIMRKARDVTYTLADVRETSTGRTAVIKSSYSPAESVPQGWPVPYTGTFEYRSPFGMLGRYKIEKLSGSGEELFNLDAGRLESEKQSYKMEVSAALRWPLPGVNPLITVDQKLTTELLAN
jgi:hypothetical protein